MRATSNGVKQKMIALSPRTLYTAWQRMVKSTRNTSLLLRIIAAAALLAALIFWIDPRNVAGTIQAFHPAYYLLALALLYAHILVQGIMIKVLLAGQGLNVRAREVFRLFVIANFFGLFLPGAIGPDLVLCYNLCKSTDRKETVLSAILYIRIMVLFVMAILAFLAAFHPLASGTDIHLLTGVTLAAFVVYFFMMANRESLALARRLLAVLERHRWTAVIHRTYFALASISGNRLIGARIAPLLMASALIKIVVDYVIALALGIDIPLIYFFVFIPVITIAAALPLTFAGIGVREGSYVGLFALAGIPAEQSVTVALVSLSLVLVVAINGAVLFALYGASLKKSEADIQSPPA